MEENIKGIYYKKRGERKINTRKMQKRKTMDNRDDRVKKKVKKKKKKEVLQRQLQEMQRDNPERIRRWRRG